MFSMIATNFNFNAQPQENTTGWFLLGLLFKLLFVLAAYFLLGGDMETMAEEFVSPSSPSDSESRAPVLVESMGEGALDCVLTLFIFGFVFLELANSPTRYPQRVGGFVMSLWRYAERRKVSTN